MICLYIIKYELLTIYKNRIRKVRYKSEKHMCNMASFECVVSTKKTHQKSLIDFKYRMFSTKKNHCL